MRLAFRLIAKDRWFRGRDRRALALGIGINAIGFTIVHAAFLRGLPFADAARLTCCRQLRKAVAPRPCKLEDWHAIRCFGRFPSDPINISDDRTWPEEVRGARLTANAFGLLRQPPLVGRDFSPGDDRIGAEPVAIIGYNLWTNRYGADRNVIGKTLRVDGHPATIIGVMPERMNFPDNNELWIPLIPTDRESQRGWGGRSLAVFGRLRDGVSRTQAQAELNATAQQRADRRLP